MLYLICFSRLRFLGKVLSAERANPIDNGEKSSGAQQGKDSKTSVVNVTKSVDEDTKSAGLPTPQPIADRLGVDYPFPPHLEYASISYFATISACYFVAIGI